jgi:AcrR family transcriptional regulator
LRKSSSGPVNPDPASVGSRAGQRERRARSDCTRTALLDAAIGLFHDRGYRATTAEDIATEVDLTKGAFYFHFANKEDCFLQALAHRERQRGDWYRLPERYDPAVTSFDEILRLTMAELALSMRGRPSFATVMAEFWAASQHRDDVAGVFARIYDGWVSEIAAFVRALEAAEWIDPHPDVRTVAMQLFAVVEGYSVHLRLYGADMNAGVFDALDKLLRPRPHRKG